MDKKPLIVAAIPAYNEERTIARVIIEAQKYVDKVIVCDDGSTDLTGEIARKLGAEVIKHERNMGKGDALRSLFKRAREMGADILITIDGDGQHDPNEIPAMLNAMGETGADVIIGSRFLTKKASRLVPNYRRIGNTILNMISRFEGITDTQSGFRVYGRRAIELLQPSEMGFAVDSELIYKALRQNLRVIEIPITTNYNVPKPSKRGPILHFLDVSLSTIKYLSMRHPLIFYGIPGLIALLIALLSGLVLIGLFNSTRYFSLPLAIITTLFGVVGIILCSTAVILWVLISAIREAG